MYRHSEIDKIWDAGQMKDKWRQLWVMVLERMHQDGFKGASVKGEYTIPQAKSSHEVVDELRRFVAATGRLNAHAGLTSSDITDNARLMSIAESHDVISANLQELIYLIDAFSTKEFDTACAGYTHLRLASSTTIGRRFSTYSAMLQQAQDSMPRIYVKAMGGATGTGRALRMLTGKIEYESDGLILPLHGLDAPPYRHFMQSSPMTSELASMQWISMIAAILYKMCNDIRFMCSTDEISIQKAAGYRGSSAMPLKNNPIEAERVCGLLRLQPNFEREVWDCVALNGMERTLDNSSSLKVALPSAYSNIAFCIDEARGIMKSILVNYDKVAEILDNPICHAEYRMAERILNGEPRTKVYEDMNN